MERKVITDFSEADTKLANFENLKRIINNIALCHAQEVNGEKNSVLLHKREFNVHKLVGELTSLHSFDGLAQEVIDEQTGILEVSVKELMDSSVLVTDQGKNELVPLSYEVVKLTFESNGEKYSQHYFYALMDFYYSKLCENLNKLSALKVFSREDFDQQIKVLLPIVKIDAALKLIKNKDSDSRRLLEEITSNITSFFKYPRLNQEDIYEVVNNKLNSKIYELLSYEMVPLDERNGHLGDYFKLIINVEFENAKQTLNLFAKFLTPKLEAMKDIVQSGASKKEEFFYMTYLPLLEKHGLQSLLDFSPKCYLSRLNYLLVLDDMASLGFTGLTPNNKIEFGDLTLIIKQIAKFHSSTMILEELLSKEEGKSVTLDEIYGEYFKELILYQTIKNEFIQEGFEGTVNMIPYLIQKFPELNKKFSYEELVGKITAGWKLLFDLVKKSDKFKNGICHGDMYVGNMLFKFDSVRRCQGAILVDFQALRYCPPVHDLLFFIYQNSFKETREKHFKQLVDGYYFELSKHLEDFNLDIAKIYPKKIFEESIEYMKPQAVYQSLFYSPTVSLEPNVREQIFRDAEMAKKYFSRDRTALLDLGFENDKYKETMRGLVADLIELCESGIL